MTVVIRTEPVEFQEPTLGRLLLGHLTITKVHQITAALKSIRTDDEVVAEYLAAVGRSVKDDATANKEGHKSGSEISSTQFNSLPATARDVLAQACIDNWQIQAKPPTPDGPLKDARPVVRLRNLLQKTYEEEDSKRQLDQTFGNLSATMGNIRNKLGELTFTPEPAFKFDPQIFQPPPNPIHKTNQHLMDMRGDLDKLIEITTAQAGVTQTLADTARDTLAQSIGAGEEARMATRFAKWGVYVAVGAFVISVALLVVDVVGHMSGSHGAERSTHDLATLIDLQRKANAQAIAPGSLNVLIEREANLLKAMETARKPNAR